MLPCAPAVRGEVDTPFGVRPKGVTERGYEDAFRVLGIDEDRADMAGALKPDVDPRLAAVVGAIDAIACRDVVARLDLSGPDVNHRRLGGGDGEGANGR